MLQWNLNTLKPLGKHIDHFSFFKYIGNVFIQTYSILFMSFVNFVHSFNRKLVF